MKKDYNVWREDPRELGTVAKPSSGVTSIPRLLVHNHSRWEPCNWKDRRCPVYYNLTAVWEGKAKARFSDSEPVDIVINGVTFKP